MFLSSGPCVVNQHGGGASLIVDCRFSPKQLVDWTFLKEKSCRFVDCTLAWKPVDCRPTEFKLCRFVDSNCALFKIVDCRFSRYYSSYYFQPESMSISCVPKLESNNTLSEEQKLKMSNLCKEFKALPQASTRAFTSKFRAGTLPLQA